MEHACPIVHLIIMLMGTMYANNAILNVKSVLEMGRMNAQAVNLHDIYLKIVAYIFAQQTMKFKAKHARKLVVLNYVNFVEVSLLFVLSVLE